MQSGYYFSIFYLSQILLVQSPKHMYLYFSLMTLNLKWKTPVLGKDS